MKAQLLALLSLCFAGIVSVAQGTPPVPADPLQPLDFLVGTWSARTTETGSAAATVIGTYGFRRDLGGHVLQRTGSQDACKGPQDFDCQHHDQLTIFADTSGSHGPGLHALYLDNEGHVIEYVLAFPDPHTVVFQSQAAPGNPQFRLSYHLEGTGPGAMMTGRFEGAAPGSSQFRPYLVWTGTRR